MRAYYFRRSQKPLFGIYHAPEGRRDRDCGIVLCYPMAGEYIRSHRAFRQLAIRLAQNGFHVLRFDYYGSGDSSGDGEEGNAAQWREDIAAAIKEIKDVGGVGKVSLVGARLGATLAALVGSQRRDVQSLVLWEPILGGSGYVSELIASHERWLIDKMPRQVRVDGKNGPGQTLGFPLTAALRSSLETLDLLSMRQFLTRRILIVENDERHMALPLRDHLKSLHVNPDYQHIRGPKVWIRDGELDGALVPVEVLESIVCWVSEVGS